MIDLSEIALSGDQLNASYLLSVTAGKVIVIDSLVTVITCFVIAPTCVQCTFVRNSLNLFTILLTLIPCHLFCTTLQTTTSFLWSKRWRDMTHFYSFLSSSQELLSIRHDAFSPLYIITSWLKHKVQWWTLNIYWYSCMVPNISCRS